MGGGGVIPETLIIYSEVQDVKESQNKSSCSLVNSDPKRSQIFKKSLDLRDYQTLVF